MIHLITTATLPWFTGVSINSLFRGVYLARAGVDVVMYLPWLESEDQRMLYGARFCFESQEAQARYLHQYLLAQLGTVPERFSIRWYQAKYSKRLQSIFPKESVLHTIQSGWIMLEEPEHFHLFSPFRHNPLRSNTIGICHTNYPYYVRQRAGRLAGWLMKRYCAYLSKRACRQVLSVGPALRYFSKMSFLPVNGVQDQFISCQPLCKTQQDAAIYACGKLIWEKGFRDLIQLMQHKSQRIDVYGTGPDQTAIQQLARQYKVTLQFCGLTDKPWETFSRYRIFVHCAVSEVCCTATLEAIAMGKWVIIPKHESNVWFLTFDNVLPYQSMASFQQQLCFALTHDYTATSPLTELSWASATQRLQHHLPAISA